MIDDMVKAFEVMPTEDLQVLKNKLKAILIRRARAKQVGDRCVNRLGEHYYNHRWDEAVVPPMHGRMWVCVRCGKAKR